MSEEREATNKARIYIGRTTIDKVEETSLSLEDKDTSAKDLMDYLIKVKQKELKEK